MPKDIKINIDPCQGLNFGPQSKVQQTTYASDDCISNLLTVFLSECKLRKENKDWTIEESQQNFTNCNQYIMGQFSFLCVVLYKKG